MDMQQKNFDPDGVGVSNGAYFGMPFDLDEARLVLFSAPWDVTVSYGQGTVQGPEVVLEASTQLDFYDPIAVDAWRAGIATDSSLDGLKPQSEALRQKAEAVIERLEQGADSEEQTHQALLSQVNAGCRRMCEQVEDVAKKWIGQDKLVGLVGGDHSTPYGLIRALGERHTAFGVLHIDAHRDLREAYEGFEFSHASIMYNVLRDVPSVTRLTQVAVRDFCQQEARLAADDPRIVSFDDLSLMQHAFEGMTWAQQCQEIVATLPQKVYVSFDIDGLSPENCPHTGTPVSGGLSFNQAVWLLKTVVDSGRQIIGFDVVEVAPQPQSTDLIDAITGARILWKLCGLTLVSDRMNQ